MRAPRAAALAVAFALLATISVEACQPSDTAAAYNQAIIIKSVLEGDKSLGVSLTPVAKFTADRRLEMRVDCRACAPDKAEALATLLSWAEPTIKAETPRVDNKLAFKTSLEVLDANGRVVAPKTRNFAGNPQAATLVGNALAGNAFFVKALVKGGISTSCDAPNGAYAFFAPTVVQPPCLGALTPGTAIEGAAPCSYLAADAFDKAFFLRRVIGLQTAAAPAAKRP